MVFLSFRCFFYPPSVSPPPVSRAVGPYLGRGSSCRVKDAVERFFNTRVLSTVRLRPQIGVVGAPLQWVLERGSTFIKVKVPAARSTRGSCRHFATFAFSQPCRLAAGERGLAWSIPACLTPSRPSHLAVIEGSAWAPPCRILHRFGAEPVPIGFQRILPLTAAPSVPPRSIPGRGPRFMRCLMGEHRPRGLAGPEVFQLWVSRTFTFMAGRVTVLLAVGFSIPTGPR
mmetsp:Transcript_33633/g.94605  ORF Transcript_33633/g.94605 Transcript_33633/m.94605 type:complete len:228 (-) Transcript_33633:1092-1775(-)